MVIINIFGDETISNNVIAPIIGGTYDQNSGTLILNDFSGGTINVTGFTISQQSSANLSNDAYDFTVWSSDTISGATRQPLANQFNSIDQNFNNYLPISAFTNTFVTGGTFNGITLILNRNDGNNVTITGFTSSLSTNISNDPYSFSIWSTDTVSGTTRQTLANQFNNIDIQLTSLSASTNTKLSSNQQIILSGDVTGTGSTAITTTVVWTNGYSTYDLRYLKISDFNTYSATTINNFTGYTTTTNTLIGTKLNISDFNSWSGNTLQNNLNLKLNVTDFNTYSGNTYNSISGITSSKGQINGYGSLDANGRQPLNELNVSPYISLTDGSTINIDCSLSRNFKLTTNASSSTVTFSNTLEGQYIDVSIVLSGSTKTITFPTNTRCINSDGTSSGNNTCTLTGVSGDNYRIAIAIEPSNTYKIISKNFGQ